MANLEQHLRFDNRKMELFFVFIFIFLMFHVVLYVLATTTISGIVYSVVRAFIYVPLFVLEVATQNPLFYGTPLWLVVFYITTIVYLYVLSYLIVWAYDKVKKRKK